jgi:CheY-like chemotaxis protein
MNNFSVLIVDDSEPDRYILKRYLGVLEFDGDIMEAHNGRTAFELIQDLAKKDTSAAQSSARLIIFLDINMPLLTGGEFLRMYSGCG